MQGKKKKPFNYQLFYRRTALIVYDIISVIAASYLAILIRYDFDVSTVPAAFLLPIRHFLPIGLVIALFVFYLFRLYHSLWAFAGETELQNLVLAAAEKTVGKTAGKQKGQQEEEIQKIIAVRNCFSLHSEQVDPCAVDRTRHKTCCLTGYHDK